jgi:hypothetical protein
MDDKDTLEQLYREAAPALLAYFRHQPTLAGLAEEAPPSHRLNPQSLSACRPLTRRPPLPRDKTSFGRSAILRPGNRNTAPPA